MSRIKRLAINACDLYKLFYESLWSDFWSDMNIVGKIVFFPFIIFSFIVGPFLIPILASILLVLMWKPEKNS